LRRRYLDATLCQVDPPYCRALSRYNRILTQRNALLRDLRERGGNSSQLVFWDERLVEHGAYLISRRQMLLIALDEVARLVHGELTDSAEVLRLRYMPSVEIGGQEGTGAVAVAFQEQLEGIRQREMAAGMTLMGPHRDELRFSINDMDAGTYGSRGQQRTVALALKLAEVDVMWHEIEECPVVLLDDVLSELDAHRRRFLLQRLASTDGPQQAIITTTDRQTLPAAFLQHCQLWEVEMGRLSQMEIEAEVENQASRHVHPE
jgi:DNA replication and repair protein RecF